MLPKDRGRRETDKEKLDQSVAYDKILGDDKISDLVILYDDKSVLLFGRPTNKKRIKNV